MTERWDVRVAPTEDYYAIYIESSDFKDDVSLRLSGDFADLAQEIAYAEEIARKLNGEAMP